ncbi:kinase-like domain-containing protein [Nemania abortiva]|nr:kinase-like domain-containing protein [Nemania abortiva]
MGGSSTIKGGRCSPGGYHPIQLGHHLHGRYRIVSKLGYGGYSTMWLARDVQQSKYVAVKVGVAISDEKEVGILEQLTSPAESKGKPGGKSMILPILDRFTVSGPNGTHPCFVTTPAQCCLTDAREASHSGLFQLDVARSLAAQLAIAVAYVHSKGYVHGDLHLKNILLESASGLDDLSDKQLDEKLGPPHPQPVHRQDGKSLTSGVPSHVFWPAWLGRPSDQISLSDAKLILCDFGVAFCPEKESRFESYTLLQSRPPEARFDPETPLSFASDIWSLGCAIWAILGIKQFLSGWLFSEDDATGDQVDALGPLPPEWWEKWERRHVQFMENGQPKENREPWSWDQRFEDCIQRPRREYGMEALDEKEKDAFFQMVRSMLSFRPEDRPSARQVLNASWMKNWAIPAYEKSRERERRADRT